MADAEIADEVGESGSLADATRGGVLRQCDRCGASFARSEKEGNPCTQPFLCTCEKGSWEGGAPKGGAMTPAPQSGTSSIRSSDSGDSGDSGSGGESSGGVDDDGESSDSSGDGATKDAATANDYNNDDDLGGGEDFDLDGGRCRLCLEKLPGSPSNRGPNAKRAPCGHWFHAHCLRRWRWLGGSDRCGLQRCAPSVKISNFSTSSKAGGAKAGGVKADDATAEVAGAAAEASFLSGLAARLRGDLVAAERLLRTAVAADDQHTSALLNLAGVLQDIAEAEAAAAAAAREVGTADVAAEAMGAAEAAATEAEFMFRRVMHIDGGHVRALTALGHYVLRRRGDLDEAELLAERAVRASSFSASSSSSSSSTSSSSAAAAAAAATGIDLLASPLTASACVATAHELSRSSMSTQSSGSGSGSGKSSGRRRGGMPDAHALELLGIVRRDRDGDIRGAVDFFKAAAQADDSRDANQQWNVGVTVLCFLEAGQRTRDDLVAAEGALRACTALDPHRSDCPWLLGLLLAAQATTREEKEGAAGSGERGPREEDEEEQEQEEQEGLEGLEQQQRRAAREERLEEGRRLLILGADNALGQPDDEQPPSRRGQPGFRAGDRDGGGGAYEEHSRRDRRRGRCRRNQRHDHLFDLTTYAASFAATACGVATQSPTADDAPIAAPADGETVPGDDAPRTAHDHGVAAGTAAAGAKAAAAVATAGVLRRGLPPAALAQVEALLVEALRRCSRRLRPVEEGTSDLPTSNPGTAAAASAATSPGNYDRCDDDNGRYSDDVGAAFHEEDGGSDASAALEEPEGDSQQLDLDFLGSAAAAAAVATAAADPETDAQFPRYLCRLADVLEAQGKHLERARVKFSACSGPPFPSPPFSSSSSSSSLPVPAAAPPPPPGVQVTLLDDPYDRDVERLMSCAEVLANERRDQWGAERLVRRALQAAGGCDPKVLTTLAGLLLEKHHASGSEDEPSSSSSSSSSASSTSVSSSNRTVDKKPKKTETNTKNRRGAHEAAAAAGEGDPLEEAEALLRRAISVDGGRFASHFRLGCVLNALSVRAARSPEAARQLAAQGGGSNGGGGGNGGGHGSSSAGTEAAAASEAVASQIAAAEAAAAAAELVQRRSADADASFDAALAMEPAHPEATSALMFKGLNLAMNRRCYTAAAACFARILRGSTASAGQQQRSSRPDVSPSPSPSSPSSASPSSPTSATASTTSPDSSSGPSSASSSASSNFPAARHYLNLCLQSMTLDEQQQFEDVERATAAVASPAMACCEEATARAGAGTGKEGRSTGRGGRGGGGGGGGVEATGRKGKGKKGKRK